MLSKTHGLEGPCYDPMSSPARSCVRTRNGTTIEAKSSSRLAGTLSLPVQTGLFHVLTEESSVRAESLSTSTRFEPVGTGFEPVGLRFALAGNPFRLTSPAFWLTSQAFRSTSPTFWLMSPAFRSTSQQPRRAARPPNPHDPHIPRR